MVASRLDHKARHKTLRPKKAHYHTEDYDEAYSEEYEK
jgi:hypothetical protein